MKTVSIRQICLISLIWLMVPVPVFASTSTLELKTATVTSTAKDSFDVTSIPKIEITTKSSLSQRLAGLVNRFRGISSTTQAVLSNPQGKPIETLELKSGQTQLTLAETDLIPGQYKLSINDQPSLTFTWGVLAINTNKSIYQPGDLANFSMAVLDEHGEMICDSELSLTISDPQGMVTNLSTKNGEIIINPECRSKDITYKPDYETNYQVNGDGIYSMSLSSTVDGTTTMIKDSFVVDSSSLFDVERITATRIFPQNLYPVTIKVTAKENFIGTFTEKVSANFIITDQTTWSLNLQAGETINLEYQYDAPDISPEFYLLGPAVITNNDGQTVFTEYRSWQIAVDAVAHVQTVTGHAEASSTTVVSDSITGVNNQLYLAAISEKGNNTVSSVTGLGLTWSLVKAQCGARAQTRTEIWSALGTVSGDGAVTATFSSAPIESVITVSRYSGINTGSPIGNTVSKNSNGIDGGCSAGTDASTYTVDLTTAVANSYVFGAVSLRARTHTASGSNTEIAEVHSTGLVGDQAGVAVEDQATTTAGTYTVSGTMSGVADYAVVAIELKPYANSAPATPSLDSPADTATGQSLTPALLTTGTDADSDYLRYKIELCTNVGMSTGCQTFDQTSSQTGWSGQNTQTNTAYTSGTQATYTIQSTLTAATTYYWRSYAIDPGGNNTWSGTQTPRSFTTTPSNFQMQGVKLEGVKIN